MHFLYVHHEHHHYFTQSDKTDINEKHDKCPICTYEFVEFIDDENFQNIGNPEFFLDYYAFYKYNAYIILFFYSFHLRAPPANIPANIPANSNFANC